MLRQKNNYGCYFIYRHHRGPVDGPMGFTAVAAIAMGACLWEWLRLAKWNNALCLLIGFAAAVFSTGSKCSSRLM